MSTTETVLVLPFALIGLGMPVASLVLLVLIYRKVARLEALLRAPRP